MLLCCIVYVLPLLWYILFVFSIFQSHVLFCFFCTHSTEFLSTIIVVFIIQLNITLIALHLSERYLHTYIPIYSYMYVYNFQVVCSCEINAFFIRPVRRKNTHRHMHANSNYLCIWTPQFGFPSSLFSFQSSISFSLCFESRRVSELLRQAVSQSVSLAFS